MEAYIKGIGNVVSWEQLETTGNVSELKKLDEGAYMSCIMPDYKQYINPMQSRRMSTAVKMGVYAAKQCLEVARVEIPDAIITGTGLGCLADTEKFLKNLIENDEKLLNPTPFIQSTHNTIGSQIALALKCHAYNSTYTHRSNSFESALLDALMLLNEDEAENVLVGGVDEITEPVVEILRRLTYSRKEFIEPIDLLKNKSKGSIAGEGAAYFCLSGNRNNALAKIGAISYIYKPEGDEKLISYIQSFIESNGLKMSDIDLILLGVNGDVRFDKTYYLVMDKLMASSYGWYKHLCGEYFTASAFALWMAVNIIRKQTLPNKIIINGNVPEKINNILIYNQFQNINHTFMLVQNA